MPEAADPEVMALLEGAMPIVPRPPLAPDDDVAVAVWREGPFCAVLFIWHDPDDEEEPYSQDIEVFEKVHGQWLTHGRGGSDWPVAFGERAPIGRPGLTGYCSGLPVESGYAWIASGIAPSGVDRVRVTMGDGDVVVDVEPITGAFLVAVPAPGGHDADFTAVITR
jgi:hypothetical protein